MKKIIPDKLKRGDEIRIIAPSRSISLLSQDTIDTATKRLEDLGFKVTFGKNVDKKMETTHGCASIEDRVADLHEAFMDPNVKAILTVIGGFNVNQILDSIDYDLIQRNPKILCGFSDITALLAAITAKTGLVTYYGPHYSSFGMKKGFDYTLEYFQKMLIESSDVSVESSNEWSDDAWFLDQENRTFFQNDGLCVVHDGVGEGTIVGGNLCTLNLLQGTEYMMDEDEIILFVEDDEQAGDLFVQEFDRNLQSLLHCLKGKKINGIVLGRAQVRNHMTIEKWKGIIETKKELKNVPVVLNADFGHTTPIFTFPLGGYAKINGSLITISERR